MAENSKVRLVRCPKCDHLLPEISDLPVYQCTACGVFLRAKKKENLECCKGLESSGEDIVRVVSEKSENLSGKPEDLVGKGCVSGIKNGDHMVGDSEGSISYVSKAEIEIKNVSFGETELGNGDLRSKVVNHVENVNGLRNSGRFFERDLSHIREEEKFRTRRVSDKEMRSSSLHYVGEGSSKYCQHSSYKREGTRGSRVEDIEPDREELLRKLEELEDQLSRAQIVNKKFREPYVEPEDYFHDHPSPYSRVPRQYPPPNHKHFATGAPYVDEYHESFALHHRSNMAAHRYHNSIHCSNYVPRYEDLIESLSPISRRPPPQRIPSHHHQYLSPELDHYESYPYDTTSCHGSCSCYRCRDHQLHVSPQVVSPSSFTGRRFPRVPSTPVPYHHELHGGPVSHGYDSRLVSTPPLGSEELKSHTRRPSDIKLERNTLARPHIYRPIGNGAPFVTCRNCFELLKLPRKTISKMGEWQMSCAACSSVLSFAVEDEKLVSVDPSLKETNSKSMARVNEMTHEYMKREYGSYCSEDFANAVFDFQAMDRYPSSSTCRSVSSRKSEEMHNIHSISSATSEEEHLSDYLSSRYDQERVMSLTAIKNTLQQNSLKESRSDQERTTSLMTMKNTLQKNSLRESLATEMEISPEDYSDTRLSKTSSDKSRDDDQLKGKRGDSFFAGMLKKSFRSNQTVESTKKKVMVNGHLIPDRLVKKAEKLAGPVSPGQYWYDRRAGFWGVIGGPCMGIIPPFIEEFNHPMLEKCAAGNTNVFVNGRELHQKDLELLSTRGLPVIKDKSYIVDITGKVIDEDNGEEVLSLGKLAPTIEKVKHGFGMRAPKAV